MRALKTLSFLIPGENSYYFNKVSSPMGINKRILNLASLDKFQTQESLMGGF
jgi:hypothetical protein